MKIVIDVKENIGIISLDDLLNKLKSDKRINKFYLDIESKMNKF